jgi:hypothetical protein
MFKRIIKRLVKRYGMKKLILMVGDYAVGSTKSKKDDMIWEEVKELLEKH